MNPFDHMSSQFKNDNRDALEGALFDQVVNPPDSFGDCIETGLADLGTGIAWFGFWIGLGLMTIGVNLK